MRASTAAAVLAASLAGLTLVGACEPAAQRASQQPSSSGPTNAATAKRGGRAAALAFIAAARQPSGGIYDARDPVWAAWESIQSAHALQLWPDPTRAALLRGAITFLDRTSLSHPHGMLYHSGGEPRRYCAETSAEYIRLLAHGDPTDRERATQLAAWLASQQQPNGSWLVGYDPPAGGVADFPSVTAYVVRALHEAGAQVPRADAARHYLEAAQAPEGHFGVLWHVYGSHHYGLRLVLEALRLLGADSNTRSMGAARGFLRASQQSDGSWWELLPGHSRELSTSPELHTALALQACVFSGMPVNDPSIARGVRWLEARQRADGSWSGGHFPFEGPSATTAEGKPRRKPEDLFATTQALTALRLIELRSPGGSK